MLKHDKSQEKIRIVIERLLTQQVLPEKNRDHILVGNWQGFRECHVEPDWLLIYQINDSELILVDTGTHTDLF